MAVCATGAFVAAAYATVQAAIYFSQAGYSESALAGGSLVVGAVVYNVLHWVANSGQEGEEQIIECIESIADDEDD
jgi:hypothetical protein